MITKFETGGQAAAKGGSTKTILILLALGVGGYFLYKHLKKKKEDEKK